MGRPTQLLPETQAPLEEALPGEDMGCVVRARAPGRAAGTAGWAALTRQGA